MKCSCILKINIRILSDAYFFSQIVFQQNRSEAVIGPRMARILLNVRSASDSGHREGISIAEASRRRS